MATRAGTGCGGCAETVDGISAWLAAVDSHNAVDSQRKEVAHR